MVISLIKEEKGKNGKNLGESSIIKYDFQQKM